MSDIDKSTLGARWYVAHTYSGYEAKVKSSLERIVANRGLGDKILDIRVPVETVIEKKGQEEVTNEIKLFPCYIFIKMIMTDETWHAVRNITGVTGFVGPGSNPSPLSDEEVADLKFDEVTVRAAYSVGDTVTFVKAPAGLEQILTGKTGIVQRVSEDFSRATVSVKMPGLGELPVDVDGAWITPVK